MKMICCQKCGTAVISDETLLQNVLDAMEEANRRARRSRPSERNAYLQEAAEHRTIYKTLMHNITQRDRAERETPFVLSELVYHLLSTGKMTRIEIDQVCDRGKQRAVAVHRESDENIQRAYGAFESASNRTKPSPTERAALNRCR